MNDGTDDEEKGVWYTNRRMNCSVLNSMRSNALCRPHVWRALKAATIGGLCLAATGCEVARIIIEPKPEADFTRYRTFAVLPVQVPDSAQDPKRIANLAEAACDTTIAGFVAKGYQQLPTNQADLLIEIEGQSRSREHTAAGQNLTAARARTAHGAVPVAGSFDDAVTNDERSVRVRAYDARSGELLWTGAAIEVTAVAARPRDVKSEVRRIVKRFPAVGVAATQR